MSKAKQAKTEVMSEKKIKMLSIALTTVEVFVGVITLFTLLMLFVPSARIQLLKTPVGRYLMGLYGKESFNETVVDLDFDDSKIKSNENLPDYVYSDEYTNFVLFGIDSRTEDFDSSANSDSIIIVSVHNTTKEVKMVSIYRDTYLEIEKNDGSSFYTKINAAYSVGGPTAALNTINTNMDLDLHDYVVVNFAGVAKIIDALGGIEVNLTEGEIYELNYHMGDTMKTIGERSPRITQAGNNIHLNGIQATTYCRIRKTAFYDPETGAVINNDFGRAARQRSVIMKLVEKAKTAGVTELQKAGELVFASNTETNKIIGTSFTWDELMNMMPIVFDFKLAGTQSFPSSFTTGSLNSVSYVLIKGLSYNVTELHKFLFDVEDYEPSYTVQNIDYNIQNYTAVYPDYMQTQQYSSMSEDGRLPFDLSNGSGGQQSQPIDIPESIKTFDDSNADYGYDDSVDDSGI